MNRPALSRLRLMRRRIGWFAGPWAIGVASLFLVATLIRLATGARGW